MSPAAVAELTITFALETACAALLASLASSDASELEAVAELASFLAAVDSNCALELALAATEAAELATNAADEIVN